MFKNRLSVLRGDRSQAEMAEICGFKSQQNYGNYENGRQALKSNHIEAICRKFGCSAEWLLCMDEVEGAGNPMLSELSSLFEMMTPAQRSVLLTVARSMVEL